MADITYIETDTGVVYLHLLTDAFTHEIIGWTLSDSLVASNTVAALDMGVKNVAYLGLDRLIHHSDRGVQYCCNQYIEHLRGINATISMTEDYKPTDNAIAERVNGIIKQEWLYKMKRPHDLEEARSLMTDIIEAKHCIHQRKALQSPTQSFATAHAKLCISLRKALHPLPQTFAGKGACQ